MNKELFGKVDDYISDLVGEEDEALRSTVRSIEESGIPQISVTANQGKFLHVLARACNAKRILEVGTLAGYSTIWLARALPKDGKLITLEFDPKHAAVARKNIDNAGFSSMVDIRIGKAVETMTALVNEKIPPFDMIFIDADKPPYAEYFELAIKLSRPGTLIVADNVIREGKVMDKETKDEMVAGARRFNQALADNKKVVATIIQTVGEKAHDGMGIAVVL